MEDDKENVPEKKKELLKDEKIYPSALASHEDVVKDSAVFMDTLRRFHVSLGTKFMIPVIGGKELDLHLLYVEVTKRGGLEKAVAERKWKDVIAVFKFPPTTTSASFVLRKYYITLLHHYEQVYFFKMGGPLVPPASVSLSVKSPSFRPKNCEVTESATTDPESQHQEQQATKRRRRNKTSQQTEAARSPNSTVVGIIEGKFDYGYLVSVKLGSEVLHGVLYHPGRPEDKSGCIMGVNGGMTSGHIRRRRKGRRRDPNHPKPNRSAYNFFFAEKHSKLKSLYPQREREFSKMIGESWNKLTDEERKVYQACGLKDKERYRREMQEYKEGLKLLQPVEGMSERRQRRRLAEPCVDHAAVAAMSPASLPTESVPPTREGTVDEN